MEGIEIVFEDQNILVINKACGIAIQAKEDDFIKSFLEKNKIQLHPITRLDQAVSGLSLFAKNAKFAAHLSDLQNEKKVKKTYIAIVEGLVEKDADTLSHKLVKSNNKAFINEEGKEAKLNYKVIKKLDRFTKLEVLNDTGRFHQIRAQLSEIGHPIKGDLKYNSRRSNKEGGIYLHCQTISIQYGNGEVQILEGKMPENKNLYFV